MKVKEKQSKLLHLPHIYSESIQQFITSRSNIVWVIAAVLILILSFNSDLSDALKVRPAIIVPLVVINLIFFGINIITYIRNGFYSTAFRLSYTLTISITIILIQVMIYYTGDPRTSWWILHFYYIISVAQSSRFYPGFFILFILGPVLVSTGFFVFEHPFPHPKLNDPDTGAWWKIFPLILVPLSGLLYWYQTNSKKREMGIRQRNEKLYDEMRRMQLKQQKERISRNLHDTLGATLTGSVLMAQMAQKEIESGNIENVKMNLIKIEKNAKNSLINMREAIFEINQEIDIVKNFYQVLNERFSDLLDPAEIKWELKHSAESNPDNDKDQIYIAVLRIMEEWINNIIRHSKATECMVDIKEDNDGITLLINDNGVGIVIDEIKEGHGIPNIHFRVNELSGSVIIKSKKNKGTSLNIYVPWKNMD